ncbi:ABC transporter thiamine pyrophosphate-binding lipoprotein p37/Cypl [Metamycoplasma buccale]|uniref:ABC transporter thiamine pyrophosphate-binding lipoprotein p37/Cypl n=1 Tax=Metamycoplasma buccale TaxID=55602 RepID=UPI00398E8700
MKKINHLLQLITFTPIPFCLVSCTSYLNFSVNAPWDKNLDPSFFTEIVKEYNKLKNENEVTKKWKNENANVSFIEENNDIAQNIIKGASDIGVMTSYLFNSSSHKKNLIPILQTLTHAFKFDKFFSKYKNGLSNDPLVEIAKKAEEMFNRKKFSDWDKKEYEWDGSKYKYFYDEKSLVDFYRGLVMIRGNEKILKEIKKAWENKDWNTFRNFGIVTGKKTSGSKYILQQALFKKHFNKEGNRFTSFEEDRLNHKDKYKEGRARDIGKGELKNYHIMFDDLGSFAYTNNQKNNKKLDYYSPENKEEKIEFLTVTEPLKYNVFVASKFLNEIKRKLLAKAIYNVWKNNLDSYGPRVGFNGYRIIQNPDLEVIKPYEDLGI